MCAPPTQQRKGVKHGMLIVRFEYVVLVPAGGGEGGGAVYLSIGGGGSTTSNTSVALTGCTVTNNTAGLC